MNITISPKPTHGEGSTVSFTPGDCEKYYVLIVVDGMIQYEAHGLTGTLAVEIFCPDSSAGHNYTILMSCEGSSASVSDIGSIA